MKRVISLLTSALVLLLMVVPAMAADANFVTTIDASADTVAVGDSVTYIVSVSGEDCTAQKLAGVTITYDKTYFELVSGEFLQADQPNYNRSPFDLAKGNGAVMFNVAHDFSGQVWKIVLKAIAESTEPRTVTISVRFGANSAPIGPVEASVKTTVTPAPCEHEWDDGKVTTEPTCTADGVRTYTCSKCQDTKTEPIPALKHNMTHHPAKDATCGAPGNIEYYSCDRCEKYFSDEKGETEIAKDTLVTDPTGKHDWGNWTPVDDDNHKGSCSVCNATSEEEPHEWDNGKVTTDPTCTVPGVKTYTCEKCGKTRTEALGVMGHDLKETPAKAATCEETGNNAYYTCSRCNKYFSDANGANEIAKDSWVTKAEGHKLTKTEAKAATCKEAGNKEYYTCSVCGKHFSDAEGKKEIAKDSWIIPATGEHTYTETVTKEATCTEKGEKKLTCKVCNDTKTVEIPAQGHDMTKTPAKAATCVAAGNTEYYSCSRCQKYFSDANGANVIAKDSWIIPATGEHTYTETVTKEATCTEKGEKKLTCSVCNDTKTVEIDALGHNEETVEVTKAATCTVDGEKVYKCSRCGEVQKTEVIKAEGHNFSTEWTVDVEATVGKAGSKSHHCLNCDERADITEIPALTDNTPTPKPDTPKTGENNVWYLCVIVLVIVSGAAVTLTVVRKKAR